MMSENLPSSGCSPDSPAPPRFLWAAFAVNLFACIAFISGGIVIAFLTSYPDDLSRFCIAVALIGAVPCLLQYVALQKRHLGCAGLTLFLYLCLTLGSANVLFATSVELLRDGIRGNLVLWSVAAPIGLLFIALCAWITWLYSRWTDRLITYEQPNGRCPECRYDLQGTLAAGIKTCPECGTAIPESLFVLPCSLCRYDLRGTIAAGINKCPECGTPSPRLPVSR
jgi:hypothetical protein